MAVIAGHHRGTIGDDRIELCSGRRAAGKRRVEPAATLYPGRVGVGRRERADLVLDLRERGQAGKIHLAEGHAAADEMNVRIVESARRP